MKLRESISDGIVIFALSGRAKRGDSEVTKLLERCRAQLDEGLRLFVVDLEHLDKWVPSEINLILLSLRKLVGDCGGKIRYVKPPPPPKNLLDGFPLRNLLPSNLQTQSVAEAIEDLQGKTT